MAPNEVLEEKVGSEGAEGAEGAPERSADGGQRTFAVIDGNSLMHRAFHAVPPTMSAPDGRPTNAVFGFISMLLKLLEDFRPDGLIVAFDKGLPKVRMEMLPQYKAQRPPRDPLLSEQFPMIRRLLEAMSVPTVAVEGWEGDDLLGTLARQGEASGHTMLLVTGDRDSYQLATERVRIVATKKGITDVVVLGPDEVAELYEGVRPEQIPDFYGLKGDTSDNIPGVPGIGPKKAAALIVQYGTLDEVLAHADEIKGKMGQNIREHVDDALVSRRVAVIRTDAPVTFDADEAAWPDFDPAEVEAAFDELALVSLKRRVLAAGESAGIEALEEEKPAVLAFPEEAEEGERAWGLIDSAVEAGTWTGVFLDEGRQEQSLFGTGLDLWVATSSGWNVDGYEPSLERADELAELDPAKPAPEAASWTATSADGTLVPAGRAAGAVGVVAHFANDEALEALRRLYGSGLVSSFDVKGDLHAVVPVDSSEERLLGADSIDPKRMFDVSVAAYLLDSNRDDYDPASLVRAFVPWELPALEEQEGAADKKRRRGAQAPSVDPESRARRGVAAAVSALALHDQLSVMLDADGTLPCMHRIEMPLVGCLVELERNGMNVSTAELMRQSAALDTAILELKERVFERAGEEFNLDSPAQLSHVLFETLGLPTNDPETGRPLKKTKTGFYSTNAKLLASFAAVEPAVADVLDYRERVKIKSTYLDALPLQVQSDGRIHTTYNQTVTATGRLSSSNPNLQNIPVRSDLGRMVRTAFTASGPDNLILSCDYSQIELRLLAHLSADEGLIEAFGAGEDFHRETAARVFGIDPKDVTPAQRSRAKAVNFGIVYGQTAWGLSQTLRISAVEAQEIIDRYYRTYPGVRGYLDAQVEFAKAHGWVATMFGRKRHVPDIYARVPAVKQFAERTAMNHPMQGSAADIIKLAMSEVQRVMDERGFAAKMVVQVHDELDFDCPVSEVEQLSALVVDIMQNVVKLRVPLLVSCETGATWADAK